MAPDSNRTNPSPMSVRKKTHQLLRRRLLVGDLHPGQRLTEESLARDLGVSRTPVREALHKLELEGLVEPAGARGFRVPAGSLAEVNELFEIRAVMEGHALACLAGIIDDENLERLAKLIDAAEDACSRGELLSVFEYNTRFHDLLYSLLMGRYPRLHSMIEDMRDYVVRYRKNTLLTLDSARRSIDGHKKIIMALNLADEGLCEQVMRNHVLEARQDTLNHMKHAEPGRLGSDG